MHSYDVLASLPASAYLDPDQFKSSFDNDDLSARRYAEGLETSQEFADGEVTISVRSVWGANKVGDNSRCTVFSYEGIGYHTGTAALLRGFLDGPAPVVVFRKDGSRTVIKERTAPR